MNNDKNTNISPVQNINVPQSDIEIHSEEEIVVTEITTPVSPKVDIDAAEIVDIIIDEAFPYASPTSDTNHSLLHGRDLPEQHPISAITDLEDELRDIKAVKPVYSSSNGLSEFRKWRDENPNGENRSGYFVTIVDGDKIEKCDTLRNVYGVTVSASGFVGNQNDFDKSDDYTYAMVGIVGAVRVRTDGTARDGEYVIPNKLGEATFSENGYGYKVLSQGSYPSYNYVTIAIAPQSGIMFGSGSGAGSGEFGNILVEIDGIKDTVGNLQVQIDNSISAEDVQDIINENLGNVQERIDTATNIANTATTNAQLAQASSSQAVSVATQAQQAAQSAAGEAIDTAKEAVSGAQSAIDIANKALEDIEETNNSIALIETVTEDNKAAIAQHAKLITEHGEGLASIQTEVTDTNTRIDSVATQVGEQGNSIAFITQQATQNEAIIQHLVTHVDKYSIGEYSLSDGLTHEEAKDFLTSEHIYIPTNNHSEVMKNEPDVETEFERNYVYTWDAVNGKWEKSDNPISTATIYEDGVDNDDLWFCWQDVERLDENDAVVDTYIGGTLYRWFDNKWVAVATNADNHQGRILTSVKQTAESIRSDVVDLQGNLSSVVQNVEGLSATVKASSAGIGKNTEDIAAVNLRADGIDATIARVETEAKEGIQTVNQTMSSIQMGVQDNTNSIALINAGRYHVSFWSEIGNIPEVPEGEHKYSAIPVWDDKLGVFVFNDGFVDDENGIYYFYDEDKTKYCKLTENGYELYTIGNQATSALNSRITTAEAILTGTALLETENSEALGNITISANEEGSAISSVASYYYHSIIKISEDEIAPYDENEKYIAPPEWNMGKNKYVFNLHDKTENNDGVYYFVDSAQKTYCHVVTTGGDEPKVLYEIYGLANNSPSTASLVQQVNANSASIGMVVDSDGINAQMIVSAINGHSTAKINAERIELVAGDTSSSIAQYVTEKTNALKNDISNLSENIDSKIDYYWQSNPPYSEYYSITSSNTDYDKYVGDFWYDTNNNITKRYTKVNAGSNVYHYVWEDQLNNTIPPEIYDKIDGKKSTYTTCPNSFAKNDIWLYEGVTTENGLMEEEDAEKEAPYMIQDGVRTYYKKNDLLIATADSKIYDPSAWKKYSLNLLKNNKNCSVVINDEYVNINNGTINLTRTDGKTKVTLDPFDGIKIQKLITSTEGSYWDNQLYADSNGDVIITGTITANAGFIGGWTISKHLLYAGNVGLYSANALETEEDSYKYASLVSADSDDSIRFWAGSQAPKQANLKILDDGSLYANAASITGTIYSNSGEIGGWTISSSGISNNDGLYYLNSDGSGRIGLMTFDKGSASFDGNIYAKNLQAGSQSVGDTTIDYGYIGNEHIADNSISPNKLYAEYTDGITQSIAAVQVYADETFATTSSVSQLQTEIHDELSGYVEKVGLEAAIETYVNGDEGVSSIRQACSGVYQKVDDMGEYVTSTSLDASIEQYINSNTGTANIISSLSGTYQPKADMDNYVTNAELESATSGLVLASELDTEIGQYIDSSAGQAKIISAASGTYQTKADMSNYVTTTNLNTQVSQYLDTASGQAAIVSAVSGTYVTQSELDNYVPMSQLDTEIGQYIDSASGTSKIISAASGTYQKKSDMSGYVTTTNLNTSIGQYIDSATGKSKIVSAASGTYQTISGMSDYAKTTAVSTIEQSVSDVEAAITLSSSYSKDTIGTNVYALLQLVSNANSSTIKIKADKIDFTGFTTFLKASDLGSSGSTSIDGGRIKTGTISADRIDVGNLKFNTLYGKGTYSSYTAVTTSSTDLYVGGSSFSASYSNIYLAAQKKVYFGNQNVFAICVDMANDAIYSTFSVATLGTTTYPWGTIYVGSTSFHWKITYTSIEPNTTSTTAFNIGSSLRPVNKLYVTELYLNGTKLTTGGSSSSSNVNFSGQEVRMGGNASYYITADTNRTLRPNSASASYEFKLGNADYYWHYAYIGSTASYIGKSTSSKLGFFGTTPVTRQTVSSSATVATLITALKAYGLIG